MKRFSKTLNGDDPSNNSDSGTRNALRDPDRNAGLSPMRVMGIFIACLILFSVLFSVNVVLRDPPSDAAVHEALKAGVLEVEPRKSSDDQIFDHVEVPKDKMLGGLLAAGFDEGSCVSRYQSASYRKEMPHKPSSYLLSRLRRYEALHKRCGPNTESYNKAVEQLKSGRRLTSSDCNYVVWISYSGLGNRILTLASAFLYALLTNRVLLVDPGVDMVDLFCEPFPEASWFLPMDFPIKNQFDSLDQKSPHCYGEMVRKSNLTNSEQSQLSSFVYLHLSHDYNDQDKLFFCNQDQDFLEKIPWLIVRTDNYFVPSLFLIPSFEQELNSLFPRKETVFHFLGRYLFHPTNVVWGRITRYYQAYLANADERIGIQIRVFDTGTGPFQHVFDQIVSCALKENLLPETNRQDLIVRPSGAPKSKAVLMTSLSSGYFEKLRDMYWEHPTVTGEVIGIYQPSHEEYQQTEKHTHNRKALAEMYLLSLTDVLITSSWSTFGYVAQSLGGLTPWILYKPEMGIEGRNFHYAVKNLECQGLLVRKSALLRLKEAGDEGELRNNPSVTTNMLYLYRHAKHLSAQQKIEIIKEERAEESFVDVTESEKGDVSAGSVLVKDFLPAMKAVCDKLEEANGKVLVVGDIKKELGYCRTSGHRAWRNICQRLKAAQLVEVFDAKVNGKVESCLRFVENSSPTRVDPRTVVHVDEDFVEEQNVKFGKKCKITDQLVELPIEHQIYEIIDAAGSEGLTRNEVMERLGIDNKKNYARFVTMCSRFEMSLQPEMHKKAVAYRFRTSGKHKSESINAFLQKSKDASDSKLSSLYDGSVDALKSDQFQPGSVSDCLTLKGVTAGPENINNTEANTDPSAGSLGRNELYNMPETSQQLFLGPKDTTSDSQVSLASTGVETNGALSDRPAALSKPLSKGSDPRYPCLSLTVDNTRREKRIVERLEGEKFILRAELYRWLVSLETDKCTATDRKTIDRILHKLQQLGHCKCINISVPVVTNLGRSRTTVVVLHPSVQSLTPELVSEIHDAWRSFEIQSRGKCSSRWREKNSGPVPILEDVQRTQTHLSAHRQTVSSEAMRANGFILAKMVRAKLLHSFLWEYLYGSSGSNDVLLSGKYVIEPKDPCGTSKLFSLEATMKAIPVELFLQVAGSTKNFEDMIEKCKRGLCLSDLSSKEYKSLMDSHATGRLSLVIDILRRLKLIRMVCDHRSENGLQVHPPIISAYALELKPYIEEPVSKDAISLRFGSLDLRPRIRHDFSLSNREAVDEYWQTLEYCYAAADPRAALLAFPGSCVHEVSHHRSWTKLGVMTAAQRDELLKRVVKDDPSEKLSFKECGKIAKDLKLTLEQVLRVYYNKRRQHLDGLQNNTDEVQPKKHIRRKRKRSSESRSVDFTENDEVNGQLEEKTHPTVSDTVEQLEELNFLVTYEYDSHLQALNNCLETGQEAQPNEDNEGCHSITTKGSSSKLKPRRSRKRNKLHTTRQRRFSWTEEADRNLIIQYVRHRATLGAKIHRVNWASLPDLPAPPVACMKRMASLKSNKKFRSAVMRLCNILSERYARVLKKTQNRSLNKDDCSLLLRDSIGEDHDNNLPNISDQNLGTAPQNEPWDDFDDNYVKKSLEEVLHHKRLAKFDASNRVGSTSEDRTDLNTSEYDPPESELIASTAPYEDVQNHGGREKKSARRSSYQHLNEKYFKLLHGVDVSTQVYKSLAVSNAVELFKLVFLSTSTAPEVPNLLASILRRYSECDLFAAFNYLRDKKFMVGGNGSQKFSLSQQFLHSTSASPFPTNSGKRATKFAHFIHEKDKHLMEGGIDLSTDLQCGEIFHLFALVSSGELSISPCLPDEGVGEAEESRSSKRKADINEHIDDERTKKLKSFVAAEGEIISRREKGFPGISVSVSRKEFSTANCIDLFKEDTPIGEKHFGGSQHLECTSDGSSSSHSDCMKEIFSSGSTVPVLEIGCNSPWEGMVGYAGHLFPLHSAQDQSSPIRPEVFKAVYTAIQKAGDQGLSIEEVSRITNIPGEKMTDVIIDVLQTFQRVLKVNAYDSIRVVDSLYRGKYFMTSVSGVDRKLEPSSWRKPQGKNDDHIVILSENRDTGAAPSEREINADVHKLTILNFPEEVDELLYEKQTENYRESKAGDAEDESSRSSNDRLCMPIFPWINGDGTTNKIVYKGLRRRVLGIVMQNPAILEDEIIRRMDVLNPQSCRKLLELMVLDNHLHVRKMHQTTCAGPPPILGALLGSSYKPSKLVCREHYYANPMSTSLL